MDVAFHTGVADKLAYTCRLLRKANRQHAQVAVAGDPAQLARLDVALWTFEPLEFLPHARLRAGEVPSQALAPTPIWLIEPGAMPPTRDVLVNLGPGAVVDLAGFARVIEIVGQDDHDRQQARLRWRQYEAAGYTVSHHPQA